MQATRSLRSVLNLLFDWFVQGESLDPESDLARRVRLVVGFCFSVILWAPLFMVIYALTLPSWIALPIGVVIGGTIAAVILAMELVRRARAVRAAGNVLVAGIYVALLVIAGFTGGITGPALTWTVCLPMFALSIAGIPSAVVWTLLCVAAHLGFYLAEVLGGGVPNYLSRAATHSVWLLALLGLTSVVLSFAVVWEQMRGGTQQALRAAREAADASNRAKSQFLANMSHELRTPMTAILGYAELLLEQPASPETISQPLEALHIIHRNGEQLLQLLNDVLDLAKIEAERLECERIRFSPLRVVGDVESLMRVRARAKGLRLQVDPHGPLPEMIEGDPLRLRQILINLLGNAIKFTEQGEVRLSLQLVDGHEHAELLFEVADTGVGMPEEQLGRVFEAFAQADASTTRRYGGTGLGLTISKRLTELMGGRIEVQSRLGKGTAFRVWLPTGPMRGTRLVSDPRAEMAVKAEGVVPCDAADERLDCRVLLAEDGIDNQRLIATVLERAGAEVEVVPDGQRALERAREERAKNRPYDVILMDMQMPVLDGYEATRTLRRHGYEGPIVALTAHAMATDRALCLAAGCDDYLTKPIARPKLLEMVRRHTAQERARRAGAPDPV